MASHRTRKLGAAVSAAALALSLSAGAVFAGEITGNGKALEVHGRSICAYSGQNDDPNEGFPFGGRVQSYGFSAVKNGLKAFAPSPGLACNPNNEFGE